MSERSRKTHGATFFSAVTGAPWDDVAPLARVLDVTLSTESATITPAQSGALWAKLSYLGSNDLAYLLRGFEGVDYPEIVRDVCKHLKLAELWPGQEERMVEHNEQLVLAKIFADAWDHLDADQRRELLRELNLDEVNMPLAGAGVAAAALGGKGGPFAVYKLSRLVANSVARALPVRRMAVARRKTAQAVVLVASLRQAQRTALAETALADAALADAATPGESVAAGPARRRRAKRPARKKAGKRAVARPPARSKKAGKAPKTSAARGAKAGRQGGVEKKKARKKRTVRARRS